MTQGIELIPQKFTILSYTIWTMSKDFLDVTEYTRTKPWIPMACLEFRIEYSSCACVKGVSTRRASKPRREATVAL